MELTPFTIFILLVVFAAGAFLGVLLGRRSKTANAYVNKVMDESDRLREELRLANAKLQAKIRDKA